MKKKHRFAQAKKMAYLQVKIPKSVTTKGGDE
jgi:hypothetical protein